MTLNIYSRNAIINDENQLKEDLEDYYDNQKKDIHIFKDKCTALLNNEIDYFISKLHFENPSMDYMIEDVYKNLEEAKSIKRLEYTQVTKADYAEFFINEKDSLDLGTLLKWTKQIMKEQFNYRGEFEIINIPLKLDVKKDYDDFIYHALEPEYNRDTIRYTIQAHRFLLLFLIFVLIVSLFNPIDYNAIKMIFFVSLVC